MDETSSEEIKEEKIVETPEKYTLGITLLDYDKSDLAIEMIKRHFEEAKVTMNKYK
jgi:hypothetical protein